MPRPFLSVVLPLHNDAKRLPLTLIAIDRCLQDAEYSYEILAVDDGSTDATTEITARFTDLIPNFKSIKTPTHQGVGAAVKIGMLAAKGLWRLVINPRGTVPLTEFSRIMPHLGLEQSHPILVASRGERGTTGNPSLPFGTRIVEALLNLFTRVLCKSRVKDFYLPFHCFSGDSAEAIFGLVQSKTRVIAAEAILRGERLGYAVKELPVKIVAEPMRDREARENYLQLFWETLTMRWRLNHHAVLPHSGEA